MIEIVFCLYIRNGFVNRLNHLLFDPNKPLINIAISELSIYNLHEFNKLAFAWKHT